MPKKLRVMIVGGGASAHVLIPFLAGAGHEVRLLTRRPGSWSERVELQLQSKDGEVLDVFEGRLAEASRDPARVVPQSDVIVLCMPVHAYRSALHEIGPHLRCDREVFVGTVYGQAGFNWMVDEITSQRALENVVTFAAGLIPWICRIVEYGRIGVTYGPKAVNVAAVSPRDRFDDLHDLFLHDICERWFGQGAFRPSDSFLSLTLSVDNQLIHPARCFGLYQRYGGRWASPEDVPYFYRDFDELSADLLRRLNADYVQVHEGLRWRFPDRSFPYMLDYLALERLTYATENHDIRESFTTSETLGAIKPPTRRTTTGAWEIDTDHRFFTDDISYGLCIAKWMAEQMALEVPMIDAIITWAQELRGERYLEDGRLLVESESLNGRFRSGIPPVYGLNTLEEAIREEQHAPVPVGSF